MTLSILLTVASDAKAEDSPPRLELPKVRPHRFSWKDAGTIGIREAHGTLRRSVGSLVTTVDLRRMPRSSFPQPMSRPFAGFTA
jgi:hypothetical protein